MTRAMTVADLAKALDIAGSMIVGYRDALVGEPGALDSDADVGFSFCKWPGERGAALVRASRARVVICPEDADESWRSPQQTLLRTPHPRRAFIQALHHVVGPAIYPAGIHPSAVVDASAVVHETASIGANVVVGAQARIGANTVIHPGVVIGHRVTIGERVVIFAGCVIGADGFGYERDDDGSVLKFIHLGGVTIGDDVEIGANTCIDRGALGNTVIGDGARIANLVQIAHNVSIGKRAFVISLAAIGGSVKIDDDAWVAPGAVVRNGIVIGERAMVGLGAVATRDVGIDEVVVGNPAKPRGTGRE